MDYAYKPENADHLKKSKVSWSLQTTSKWQCIKYFKALNKWQQPYIFDQKPQSRRGLTEPFRAMNETLVGGRGDLRNRANGTLFFWYLSYRLYGCHDSCMSGLSSHYACKATGNIIPMSNKVQQIESLSGGIMGNFFLSRNFKVVYLSSGSRKFVYFRRFLFFSDFVYGFLPCILRYQTISFKT